MKKQSPAKTAAVIVFFSVIAGFVLLVFAHIPGAVAVAVLPAPDAAGPVMTPVRFAKGNRELVVFPMIHCASREFYEAVGDRIESLRDQGWTHFYEWVTDDRQRTPSLADKIVASMIDPMVEMRKACFAAGLTWQELGFYVDSTRDVNADMTASELEAMSGRGSVTNDRVLSTTMAVSPMRIARWFSPMKFRSLLSVVSDTGESDDPVIIGARNERAMAVVNRSGKTKACLTYGKMHLPGLRESLLLDGWTEIGPDGDGLSAW